MMTSKELWKKRIEYAVKNNDKTLETLAESLEILEIFKDKLYFNCQSDVEEKLCYKIIMKLILLTDDEYEKVKEWLEND